jgi:hypothetical protein
MLDADSFSAPSYSHGRRLAGNNFEDGRTAGEAVLCFPAEQSRGNAGSCKTPQHPKHSRSGPERLLIHRFSHRADYRE